MLDLYWVIENALLTTRQDFFRQVMFDSYGRYFYDKKEDVIQAMP